MFAGVVQAIVDRAGVAVIANHDGILIVFAASATRRCGMYAFVGGIADVDRARIIVIAVQISFAIA